MPQGDGQLTRSRDLALGAGILKRHLAGPPAAVEAQLERLGPPLVVPGNLDDEPGHTLGHLQASATREEPDGRGVAVDAGRELPRGELPDGHPPHAATHADVTCGLCEHVEPGAQILVMKIKNERLPEERPECQVVTWLAEVVARDVRQPSRDEIGEVPFGQRDVRSGRARCRVRAERGEAGAEHPERRESSRRCAAAP